MALGLPTNSQEFNQGVMTFYSVWVNDKSFFMSVIVSNHMS